MNLHRRPDGAVVAVACFEDDGRPSGADATQEDQAVADVDGAADDRILAAHFRVGRRLGGDGIALIVTERWIETVDIGGGEEILRGGTLPVNLARILRGEDGAQHAKLAVAAGTSHGI